MWKEFFYFTKKERTASLFLIVVIILLIITIHLLPFINVNEKTNADPELIAAYIDFCKSLEESDNERKYNDNYTNDFRRLAKPPIAQRFAFDPNTADSATFFRLGLKPFQIRNILKYRQKGGTFRKQADFSKIYGIEPSLYNELKPYIQINNYDKQAIDRPYFAEKTMEKKLIEEKTDFVKQEKYAAGTIVDLNKADTTELKKIPGIGSVFAKRIVQFRERLGGFYTVTQIKEVYGITPDKYQDLAAWFTIDANQIVKIPINKSSIDQLRQHPYINYHQAKAFVETRKGKGKLHDLSEVSLLEEFTEKDLERLLYYIDFK